MLGYVSSFFRSKLHSHRLWQAIEEHLSDVCHNTDWFSVPCFLSTGPWLLSPKPVQFLHCLCIQHLGWIFFLGRQSNSLAQIHQCSQWFKMFNWCWSLIWSSLHSFSCLILLLLLLLLILHIFLVLASRLMMLTVKYEVSILQVVDELSAIYKYAAETI